MPKQDHIKYEDLVFEFGESMTAGSNFFFSKEENEYRQEIRAYFKKEIAPFALTFYASPNFKSLWNVVKKIPTKYFEKFTPAALGGEGLGCVYEMIFLEELCAVSYSVGHQSRARTIPIGLKFFSKELIEEFVKPALTGNKLQALAITEPTSGSDAIGGLRSTAKQQGDDYIINGEKRYIAHGSVADFCIVYAITDPNVHPRQGITGFVVPTTNNPAYETVQDYEMMGREGTVLSHVRFNNCKVSKKYIVGELNKGYQVLIDGLNRQRVTFASVSLGAARSAFEIATRYAAERMQFGQPIREFESVSTKISDMFMKIEASRMLCLKAARLIDAGMNANKEASAAKAFTADNANEIAYNAMQVLGGIGYMKDYPIERICRDVRVGNIADGTSDIQRFVIQRQIYRELGYIK